MLVSSLSGSQGLSEYLLSNSVMDDKGAPSFKASSTVILLLALIERDQSARREAVVSLSSSGYFAFTRLCHNGEVCEHHGWGLCACGLHNLSPVHSGRVLQSAMLLCSLPHLNLNAIVFITIGLCWMGQWVRSPSSYRWLCCVHMVLSAQGSILRSRHNQQDGCGQK